MQRSSKAEANRLSVRLELQADCLAGVWGYHADKSSHILEAGDLEEALRAASAIGDDRIMKQTAARLFPMPSPTAPRNSGCAGSGGALRRGT